MFRTLAAIALSGALALTPLTAGPAQALDERDILGILAGVAALAIIKNELDDREEEKRAAAAAAQRNKQHYNRTWNHHRHRVLPGQCRFRLEDRQGRLRNVIGPRCLRRNGVHLANLPSRCLRDVRTTRGFREAYVARCLKREGWEIDGVRRIGN
jgi:hypothetical protein